MDTEHLITLNEEDAALLEQIATAGNAAEARRARLLLLAKQDVPLETVAKEVGLSTQRVQHWLRAFEDRRMGVFLSLQMSDAPEEEPANINTETPPSPLPPAAKKAPQPGIEEPRRKLKLRKNPGVKPEHPMSEAGRLILHYHFERMLLHEPSSRLGEDIEGVHQMRVATRRMRSALSLFEPYYRAKPLKPLKLGLRRTARALGGVRDLDVFREKLAAYQQSHPEATNEALSPLLEDWHERRESARARLLKHLDSEDFARFIETMSSFLEKEFAGARKIDTSEPVPYQVRHVVPRLIFTRFEAVRAYEPLLETASVETLHALRIEGKRLRYALEFFAEVLGPEGKTVINMVKRFQDHLGDINDAEVAGDYLRDFIDTYERAQDDIQISERQSIAPILQYMASRFEEKHSLISGFQAMWEEFNAPDIRQALGLAVAAL